MENYTTVMGDTWDNIAYKVLGDEKHMKEFIEANIAYSHVLMFDGGTELTVPELAAEAESRKDFIHKLKIAMKELSETRVWLKIIGESSYVPANKLGSLITECEELSRILAASIITARGKRE